MHVPRPNSKSKRRKKSKIDGNVARVTRNPDTHLKIKRSKVVVARPINAATENMSHLVFRCADSTRSPSGTISHCYGKQISAECESHHVIRVVSAAYLKSRDCVGGASDMQLLGGANESLVASCRRDDVSGPQCVGNRSCIFTAPWIYISADCGYSNYFSLQYQCVPGIQLPALHA